MTTHKISPAFAANPLVRDADGAPERQRYERGTGPFLFNRSQRRSYRGVSGRHDASKAPTPGRVTNRDWRGHRPKPKTRPATLRRPGVAE